MKNNISINAHSSIRIEGGGVLYVDPFMVSEESHDADVILITHDHHDHFSPEDSGKVAKEDTIFVCPENCVSTIEAAGIPAERITGVCPGHNLELEGALIEVVPAYNIGKQFHPKENNWVGYIVTIDDERIYVAGDTDDNEDIRKVVCDVAMVPIGGTYTMTADEAAGLINAIKPKVAIPTHYNAIVGSKEDEETFIKAVDEDIEVIIKL